MTADPVLVARLCRARRRRRPLCGEELARLSERCSAVLLAVMAEAAANMAAMRPRRRP